MGVKFRRQHPVGPYFADFACVEQGLIIELDGGQHGTEEGREYDAERTAYMSVAGFKVLRFWNNEVMTNLPGVLQVIKSHLK